MSSIKKNLLKSSIISPLISLKEALGKIDSSKLHILVIINDKKQLIGTITDGDIRRSLLSGHTMDTNVMKIANLKPRFVTEGTNINKTIQLMQKEEISQIPIVNDKQEVINIITNNNFIHNLEEVENSIVIIAGGEGKRLRPITYETPKPLIKIGNLPIIETMITIFSKQGFSNFLISVNYQKEKFYEYFDNTNTKNRIEFINEEKNLGTAGPLAFLNKRFNESFIVINGDILCKVNLRNMLFFHDKNTADITLGVKRVEEQIPYGVVNSAENDFQSIDEKPLNFYNILTGVYIFSNKIDLSFFINQKIDMPELINQLKAEGKKIVLFPIEEYWIDIGNLSQLERAELEFSNEFS